MKRTALRRHTPLARIGRVKRRNVKRATANRQRSYGDKADWIREQPCAICGVGPRWNDPIIAAHTRTGGKGRKADAAWLIPLHHTEHERQHDQGWSAIGLTRARANTLAEQYEGRFRTTIR